MNHNSELDCFLYFMWNYWRPRTCAQIFPRLADHIWNKWVECCRQSTSLGAPAVLYSLLDLNCRKTLVEYATDFFRKHPNA